MKHSLSHLTRRLGVTASVSLALSGLWGCATPETSLEEQRAVGINTIRDPSFKSDKACGPYPSYYIEYLDDTKCRKRLPSDRNRDFQCPLKSSPDLVENTPGYAPLTARDGQVTVDESALAGIVPSDVAVTMIVIRRVGGVPYYRYLSNGRHNDVLEMWSSSKFLGIINASESIRYSSDGEIGLDSSIEGIPLGDLVTVVHNYEESNYTSNGLMYWFYDVGGRGFANQMVHSRWLNRPDAEEYGGNYGAKPPELGFTFTRGEQEVEVKPFEDWRPSNKLSTFTLAEALKRLVMHREDPAGRLEYSTWDDIKVLLYGATESLWYDDKTPQGMESDTAVYVQEAVNIGEVDQQTQGQWRIFSKLGLGFSRGGEFVHTDYACLPVFNDKGEPELDAGAEVVISVHLPANKDYVQGDRRLAGIYRDLIQGVLQGTIR